MPPQLTKKAALATLIILQCIMLAALFTKTPPHPPVAIPLFGIAPFLGASLATAVAAWIFQSTDTSIGKIFCFAAALFALVSFGPQKYFDAQFFLIWPAVIGAQIAAAALLFEVFKPCQIAKNKEQTT